MGSGGSKSHESFAVAPGATLAPPADPPTDEPPPDLAGAPPQLIAALDALGAAAELDPDTAHTVGFHTLKDACAQARQQLADSVADGAVDEQTAAAAESEIKAATTGFLSALPPQALVDLAAEDGFAHPHLVGFSDTPGHPLVHYLDPAYPSDITSKAAIAAKAEERYAMLAAGQSVHGLTLNEVTALEAHLPTQQPSTGGGQPISAGQALSVSAQVTAAATELGATHWTAHHQPDPAAVTTLLAAENALATATCPDAAEGLSAAQAAARGQVDAVLAKVPITTVHKALADPELASGLAANTHYLAARDQLALARANLDPATRTHLETQAATRGEQVSTLQQATAAFVPAQSDTLGNPIDPAALPGFATTAGDAFTAAKAITPWKHQAFDPASSGVPTELAGQELGSPDALTAQFTAWSKQQKLADLRYAAAELGLADAPSANRAQITKYIAGSWESSLHQPTIQGQVSKKAAPVNPVTAMLNSGPATPGGHTAAASPSTPSPSTATAAGATTGTVAAPPSAATWMAQHQRLVDALKHHQASASALPGRHDLAAVESWTFTPSASAASLGGVHTKSYVTGPDGSSWMFKPDTSAGGARAHAESAAARVYHAVGIPAVDVHVASIAGKTGSVQPLLPGAGQLPASAASWTQGDVDAIVRYHVAAWAVGDHDGGPANVLRTGSGGLVPCDAGQAFKFYGRDKLSADYNPNAGHGSPKAVFHQAYAAAASHGLAAGVAIRPEAAAGVLAAFEALPDTQYRAMLHTTAHEGAKHNVHWAAPMRKAAAKKHGLAAEKVTTAQIAEQFLDHAVARKHTLRSEFVSFFTGLGHAGAAKLNNL